MTEEQVERLLVVLTTIGENLEGLSSGVWEISMNLELLMGEADKGKAYLRMLDIGRE